MSIKNQWVLNILMMLLSWSALPLLGKGNIKRFFPATFLIGIIEILHARIGKKRKYWVFYNKTNSYTFGELPFNSGPFIFISLWTLKLAYGNFKKFILINALVHAFFAFPYTFIAKKVRYYTLVRFNNIQFFIYFFSKAFLLYWFQYLYENKNKVLNENSLNNTKK
ncbi:hypothetical protein [Metabacillus halosaccharovorans]|uniref:hypothetical protein n=1 Tax=Metabacillus halosaccharovorans TaxID=930124 RepID=UPI001C1F60B8|nr:hypothetical protein [Metabacillus halosaccharovorans]MBU7595389.1 hypothetical protein [Metabacillus halosaccharovorans]